MKIGENYQVLPAGHPLAEHVGGTVVVTEFQDAGAPVVSKRDAREVEVERQAAQLAAVNAELAKLGKPPRATL